MVSPQNKKSLQKIYRSMIPMAARQWVYRTLPSSLKLLLDNADAAINELPPPVTELDLPGNPGPSRFSRRINKICGEEDWRDEGWLAYFDALGESPKREIKHRKSWEWVQGLYALEQLNLLRQDARAIGVGAGTESVLYFLANRIEEIIATDIYGQGEFVNYESPADMVTNPKKYANLPYREDHLTVMFMDGLDLVFADNSFDFAFSFSSIEHFGGHEAAQKAVAELCRVVKPGGAVIITTEVILHGHEDEEYFLPDEIARYLLSNPELRPIEDIDYTLSEQTFAHYVDTSNPDFIHQVPHLVLKRGKLYYTSVCLALEKI